jgi:hypothetical protein
MGTRDARVDAYIDNAADFAKPILRQLRRAVHDACPQVQEDMKWRCPHFMYKGILCYMAAFSQHAAFGIWRGSSIVGARAKTSEAMGQFGRLTTRADLPAARVVVGYIKKATALRDEHAASSRRPTRERRKTARASQAVDRSAKTRAKGSIG